ncbi:MAG: 50S ribosomal protein L10 [Candidatus Cryptobacteroides sp.]|nr:50S ribosomal protein L10 [Bacteroidales bacterium]MDD6053262.1 50S ribosomal protein L10 [Bacteroidales bacterium]
MRKELKAQIIEQVSAQLKEYPNFYITDISGLDAEQTTKLRRACFDKGVKLTVVKNTLFAKALEAVGNDDMKSLIDVLVGNTAIMYTEVPAAPGKIIKALQKEGFQKPVVKGAYVQECTFVGPESLEELASIKTKEELIGDIITLLQSPINRVISALENKDKKEGEDAAEAEAPAAE